MSGETTFGRRAFFGGLAALGGAAVLPARGGAAPSLALIEGRRGAGHALRVEAPLILRDDRGEESAESKRIYHR